MSKAADYKAVNDMEFLVNELHKEWDRSGADEETVGIGMEEASDVNEAIMEKIEKQQEELEGAELTFQELMDLTRKNYVLLRMARKIKSREGKVSQKGMDYEFQVSFDNEELKQFQEMFEPKLKRKEIE